MAFLQRVVHNDAMRADPPQIYNWRSVLMAVSSCFGAMSFGMDSSIVSGVIVLPNFVAEYHLSRLLPNGKSDTKAVANLQGNIVSTLQGGCFVGALAAAPLADKFGRRKTLMLAAAITFVGVVMQFNAWGQLPVLYIGRFITGLGVGGASMVNPIYIAENSPRAIRGGLTGLYQFFIVLGGMLAFWINYAALLKLNGKTQYILPLAIQGLPALFLFFGMALCNESPRWIARQDRWEQARTTLATLRNLPESHPYVEEEFQEIYTEIEIERQVMGNSSYWGLQKEMWSIPGSRKRAIISIILMVCQQMTGTNAINNYAPQIFKNLGIVGNATALFATGVYGCVKLSAVTVFLVFVADSLGRRRSLLWTSIAQGLCMFYIGLYIRIAPPLPNAKVPPAGYVALVCIFLFAAFFQFGWGPCCWIYASEIPSARFRAINISLAAATQWLFNFVVARTVPVMLATVGDHGYGTYLIFGSFCFSMFFFVWFFVPETKGISLEKMDELFGATEFRDRKMADDEEQYGAARMASERAGPTEHISAATLRY